MPAEVARLLSALPVLHSSSEFLPLPTCVRARLHWDWTNRPAAPTYERRSARRVAARAKSSSPCYQEVFLIATSLVIFPFHFFEEYTIFLSIFHLPPSFFRLS